MKILAIRTLNLASLEGKNEIDFTIEPLKSAGIFAITGSTGAGKSTLLDALCLALYAKTPRQVQAKESGIEIHDVATNKIGQGDARSILRKGTSEGYAEVDFIGTDQIPYRSRWSVRRARGKSNGSLQADMVELIHLSANKIISGKKTETLKEIERLVGLSFEQFTRSVLLAQGDFTAFLKADKDEKASLLEKLTGTDHYSEISIRIFNHAKQADADLRELQHDIDAVKCLTEEELLTFQTEKTQLTERLHVLNTEQNKLHLHLNWFTELRKLEEQYNQAQTDVTEAEKLLEESAERIALLRKIESVQDARDLCTKYQLILADYQKKKEDLQHLIPKATEAEQKQTKVQQLHDCSKDKLTEVQQQKKSSELQIQQARELDTKITGLQSQIPDANKAMKKAKAAQNEFLETLSKKQYDKTALTTEITQLESWRAKNMSLEKLSQNLPLVHSKLDDLQIIVTKHQSLEIERREYVQKTENTNLEIEKFSAENSINIQKSEKTKALCESLIQELKAVDSARLKTEEKNLRDAVEHLQQCANQWNLLFQLENLLNNTDVRKNEKKAELESNQKKIIEETRLKDETNIQWEQAKKMLEKAERENSKTAEQLRSQLIDGDACPVCGSMNHPYAHSNPVVQNILEDLRRETEQLQQKHLDHKVNCETTLQLNTKLQQEILTLEKELENKRTERDTQNSVWLNLKPTEDMLALPNEERATWFIQQLNDAKQQIGEIQKQLTAYEQKREQTETLNLEFAKLEKQKNEVALKLSDLQKELEYLKKESKRLQLEQKSALTQTESLKADLSEHAANPNWFTNWQQDPVEFKATLQRLVSEWNEKSVKLLDLTSDSEKLLSEINVLKEQQTAYLQRTEDACKIAEKLQNQTNDLLSQRLLIFEGKAIADVEAAFNKAITDEENALTSMVKNLETAKAETIRLSTLKKEMENTLYQLETLLETQKQKLEEWLGEYSERTSEDITLEQLEHFLSFTNHWIQQERETIKTIEDTVQNSKTVLNDRVKTLLQHRNNGNPQLTEPELLQQSEDLKLQFNEITARSTEIDLLAKQDTERKIALGESLVQLEAKRKIWENWQKLNDLLGSADGKKFRQIAQEYTLDHLLGYANAQLCNLSNRYLLSRIPSTLALQVTDKDMGDEIRSVHSLSGGESFLVSLSLALGLASLSTSRMSVESLFIDEGFGSLDPQTLTIAMDALERLQNQGRKVGVISHVQEMTERIPTRINVKKLTNGKSKVMVTMG